MIEQLKQRSGGAFDLPEGTVYPVLHRLEAEGLLASEWSEGGGRPEPPGRLEWGGFIAARV